MPYQLLSSDKILRVNDYSLLGLVQSQDWSPNFNAQDIFELGLTSKVDTAMELETSGSFEVLASGNLPGLLTRLMVARNASGDFLGYAYNSGGAPNGILVTGTGGKNAYTFDENAFKECVFDLVLHEKVDQTQYSRSVILPRCFLTSVSGRYDAGGTASDTLNFQGDFVIGAVAPYHDVRVLHATQVSSVTAQAKNADGTNFNSTGYKLMYVYADERRFGTTTQSPTPATTVALHATSGLITWTTSEGYTVSKAHIIKLIAYKDPTGSTTFPVLAASDRSTSAFYIRGYQSNIFLAPATIGAPTAAEQFLKVQSADFTIDLRTEALRQIAFNAAGTSVYARLPNYPLDISVNATVYEYDWADWKAVLNTTNKDFNTSGSDPYKGTYDLAPNNLKSSFNFVIESRTKDGTLLQTWRFDDLRVDGYGHRISVGGKAEVTWSFKGTSLALVGANG